MIPNGSMSIPRNELTMQTYIRFRYIRIIYEIWQ
ncbi:hypothetical protein F383_23168 [Gossypium arboreum]|uniref:Uncharacterized protein n=1 Tax=Gossypium arboreum TaxID=29729 RepID=A0A0B0MQ84_GOSAR|nr:hypothetical protein F383_23168 [Gossypium arboreum]